jgi:diaminopimelate decarboxylase/aspartate kinase
MKTIQPDTFPGASGGTANLGPPWLVMKFGGTSVATPESWQTIRELVAERLDAKYRVVVVHSALAGISNDLEASLQAAADGNDQARLADIEQRHYGLAESLGVDGEGLLAADIGELNQLLAGVRLVREVSPRVQAKVMALGELMATRLGAAFLTSHQLPAQWVDARDILRSIDLPHENERSRYLAATCAFDPDTAVQQRLAEQGTLLLTQGFIASNVHGEIVLLGRGGSDTSAAYIAAKLQARALEIWTDVAGMFSANPRIVPGARLLKALSFQEAQEIASTGGSVLHPRCIRPARREGIPIRVRCTLQPTLQGTLISDDPGSDAPRVTAISGRSGITVVSMETVGMWQEVGFLADAFRCFSELGLSIDLVSTAESSVTVTLDTSAQAIDMAILARLRASLERLCRVEIIEEAEVVSLVGQKIRALLHQIGPALEVFEEHRIHLVSQAASDLNLSFVVEEGQAHRLTKKLHGLLVKPGPDDPVFGQTWEELQAPTLRIHERAEPWWIRKRQELLDLMQHQSSAYVYDLDTVRAACKRLMSLSNVDRIFYAIKANSHPEILREVGDAGVNFECVSPGEISRVLETFPDLDPGRILFTPNFAPRSEYEYAAEQGVRITLDNLHPLRQWGDLFRHREVVLRLDTGQGRGHHEHVRTAGVHSKFGIPLFEIGEARELVASSGARVTGLHTHSGSGILEPDNWREMAEALVQAADEFDDIQFLDLGGGLGVPERPGQRPLDMEAVDASLAGIRAALPGRELWLEPGRYLVAEAGILLATVTQVKGKGEVRYVGVSTGMNSLIRPALYGAYHEIVNLTRIADTEREVVNIVGPNCESGDRLGNDRLLPRCQEGDILLIANAGAYGYVMSSHYNLREPAVEVPLYTSA